MRGFAYAVAVLAAVGIMVAIASRPGVENSNAPAAVEVSSAPMPDAGTVTLSVPEMHCSFACFPRVKKSLEGTDAVKTVELAPQKEEGVIDNRQVIVTYDAGFKLADALSSLQKEGFADSEAVR